MWDITRRHDDNITEGIIMDEKIELLKTECDAITQIKDIWENPVVISIA